MDLFEAIYEGRSLKIQHIWNALVYLHGLHLVEKNSWNM